MASQPGTTSSALPAAAHVVGNAFVNQYYNVLHQSPQVVHRFYTDASRLTRAEAGADGAVETVVSQSEIHQKVMSLDYGDFKAEIVTVDSQDSLTGGVLVMVTGSLYKKLSGKKNFVQSFFLAPQEKGYFVLNDIFRYVDEDDSQTTKEAPAVANGSAIGPHVQVVADSDPPLTIDQEERELSPIPVPELEQTVEEILETVEQIEVSEAEDDDRGEELSHVDSTSLVDEPSSPVTPLEVPVPANAETCEVPKKSYASIVSYASILRTKENAGSSVTSTAHTTSPKAAASAADRVAAHTSHSVIATSGQDITDDSATIENDGSLFTIDGRSVYVKNLPMSISTSQLEEEFGKIGVIKPGGVIIKNQKQGVCYAFVEFEDAASAQTAIESSPVLVAGRQVYVEEKRPVGPRAGSRGGRPSGIGRGDRSFRSDGQRGRPSLPSRGRGIATMRNVSGSFGLPSGVVASSGGSNGSGDSSRKDVQVGNGNRVSRRGGGNHAPRNVSVSRGSPPMATV